MINDVLLMALLAGSMTILGGLPFFFLAVSHRLRDNLLGFSAGMMVTAAFSLISEAHNYWLMVAGMGIGALLLSLLIRFFPEGGRLAWLSFIAISLHNIPEGLVVGVGYAEEATLGLLMAVTIGIQNMPEGLMIVAPLLEQGINRWNAFFFLACAALVEPVFAVSGYVLVAQVNELLPLALGFAAGSMLYVTFRELIPETHGHGYEGQATFSFLFGVVLMLGLGQLF
ncbi:ZIP family metal transporter [Heliophilum fasciatum]|uniref:ZIP family zinc transporter n=1 Tax=Heliophilum fasciatum TaxID=35700 RepID=A0A4R2RLT9_9FIRM|nr:ZIP family metal transporter [Heliophilum fasciatum]MCW2278478.1 ZIP family zinc transporter [Heliophilum fasciatum]TCP63609.1 ZIP family zinc transporter [Heliophilum fasciatum]